MHCSSNKLQYAALFALIILKKCNFLHIIEPYFGNGKKNISKYWSSRIYMCNLKCREKLMIFCQIDRKKIQWLMQLYCIVNKQKQRKQI